MIFWHVMSQFKIYVHHMYINTFFFIFAFEYKGFNENGFFHLLCYKRLFSLMTSRMRQVGFLLLKSKPHRKSNYIFSDYYRLGKIPQLPSSSSLSVTWLKAHVSQLDNIFVTVSTWSSILTQSVSSYLLWMFLLSVDFSRYVIQLSVSLPHWEYKFFLNEG